MWKQLIRIITKLLAFGRCKPDKPRRAARGVITGRERVLT